MNKINLDNIPSEPTVTILNPDGSVLITTNDLTTFTYIRSEIKTKQLIGYKIRFADGRVHDIRKDGKIFIIDKDGYPVWPDGTPGDVYEKLLYILI